VKKLLLASLLVVSVGVCLAEDVVLPADAIMRGDRSLTSIKAGTTVEVVARGDKMITIRYKGQTGTIPASSLAAKDRTPAAPSSVVAKTAPAPTPSPKKSLVVDNPQSTYGNLVKKAETNAEKHDDNLVKPADEVTGDNPSK
jgi:hypothetical protein